ITVYGDGRQVRDVLFVDDLVDAMVLAMERVDSMAGRAFNVGGGAHHTVSLLELLDAIESMLGSLPQGSFEEWRPGDQRYYVSCYRRFEAATGWRPRCSVSEGLERLRAWLIELHRSSEPRSGHSGSRSRQLPSGTGPGA